MSGYTILMQCPHCDVWCSVQEDNCGACGQPLIPEPENAVEKPCNICGATTRCSADEPWPVCRECITQAFDEAWEARP